MEAIKELLQGVFLEIVKYAVAALIPIIGLLIGKLLMHLTKKIDNETFRGLAIQAVLFAEDKLGPDTNLGQAKLRLAVDFLVEKTKISREQAEALVRAAYQNIFVPFGEKATS